jgi:hypothetical protein
MMLCIPAGLLFCLLKSMNAAKETADTAAYDREASIGRMGHIIIIIIMLC